MAITVPINQPAVDEDAFVYSKNTVWRRFRKHKLAMAGAIVLLCMIVIAVFAWKIAPFDPKLDPFGPAKFADAAAKQRYYESLFAGAPQAKVQVIQPSRHFIMYDQPAALDAALDAALR